MSVPADRMAPRNPAVSMKDPNKIMGLDKKVFWVIVILGLLLAYYIYKRSTSSTAAASAGTSPDGGVTAADIGGTPADNSFATQTDADALEQQIQALQSSISQLNSAPAGSTTGAGIGTPSPVTTDPTTGIVVPAPNWGNSPPPPGTGTIIQNPPLINPTPPQPPPGHAPIGVPIPF